MGPVYAQLWAAPERHWLWAVTCKSELQSLGEDGESRTSLLRHLSDVFFFFAGADDEAVLREKEPFLNTILDMAMVRAGRGGRSTAIDHRVCPEERRKDKF